jgi:hypothetical protein
MIKASINILSSTSTMNSIPIYYYEWSFIIKCSNIREFKPYIKMGYDEFDAVYKEHKRNNIISEILDNG